MTDAKSISDAAQALWGKPLPVPSDIAFHLWRGYFGPLTSHQPISVRFQCFLCRLRISVWALAEKARNLTSPCLTWNSSRCTSPQSQQAR